MTRPFFFRTLTFGIAASALVLASCSTTETRISGRSEIYQTLSPKDQALVSQGQIRTGMSQNAVWLAWGSPDRKIVGNMRGRPTETWIYVNYTTAPYGYGYPYGPYRYGYGYGFGFTSVGFVGGHHHHHGGRDRKSTRLNSSHRCISYAVFCLKKKNTAQNELYLCDQI